MVRLVFRPYTQIWRSICTSESLRASIRVSSDFTLFRHSSPSFGSQQICSYSNLSVKTSRSVDVASKDSHLRSLSFRVWVCHPNTRIYVRLLGPCFKTGHLKPLSQWPKLIRSQNRLLALQKHSQSIVYPTFTLNTTRPTFQLHSSVQYSCISPMTITLPEDSHISQGLFPTHQTDVDIANLQVHPSKCIALITQPAWLVSNVSLSTISRTV